MGAIMGIYQLNQEPVPAHDGYKMMKSLQQFPHDEAMLWQQDNLFLGCNVQWNTPESAGEVLPYYDKERKLAITADAVIENRAALLDALATDCLAKKELPDSLLFLQAYQKWGEALTKYVAGDVTFMIWDENRQKLFGARGRPGSQTLYYVSHPTHFAFCSIIQPLLLLPYSGKRFNEAWIADFFLASPGKSRATNPASTIYKNMKQVPPFHTISVRDGKIEMKSYEPLSANEKRFMC